MLKNVLRTLDGGHPSCEDFVKHPGCWMNGRRVQDSSRSGRITRRQLGPPAASARSRKLQTLAAFLTGVGFFALALCSLRAGVAAGLIDDLNDRLSFVTSRGDHGGAAPDGDYPASNVVWTPLAPPGSQAHRSAAPRTTAAASSLPRRSVCVRLCDGYHFPIGPLSQEADLNDHEAACASLCPDAPTRVFIEPGGSDRIEDAVAEDGARYVALPTAFHNRARLDKACACHRQASQGFPLLDDFTLRKGDAIMTPSGIVVFRGAGHAPFSQDDFTTLANAALPRDRRAVLAAIERAAVPNVDHSSEGSASSGDSEIAFAAPPATLSTPASRDNSIHFVEPPRSASN